MGHVPRQTIECDRLHFGEPDKQTFVENGATRSLLLSFNHHRVGSGWSGGGPFYQITNEMAHLGFRPFPGYKDYTGVWRPASDAVGVSPAPIVLYRPSVNALLAGWAADEARNFTFAAAGFRATRPGNPLASLGQFLVELRDLPGIPYLKGRDVLRAWRRHRFVPSFRARYQGTLADVFRTMWDRARGFSTLGAEYLNYAFGWRPFIHDLQQAYRLWQTIDKHLAQIIRDNGKGVRRKATLSNTSSITSQSSYWPWAGVNVRGFPQGMTLVQGTTHWTKEVKTEEKVWYAARYRYYIPDVTSSQWTTRARLALFGALPTPALIWEVIPWSWLIDWAVNVGDVVSNMSMNAVDNLTQDYSFIMRRTVTTTTWKSKCKWAAHGHGHFPAGNHEWTTIQKDVVQTRSGGGSPYALNAISGAPFTGYQKGVLAALGSNLVNQC